MERRSRRSPPGFPRRGVTLLELLVVLTLIASLLGIGVGIASRLTFGRGAAIEMVRDVLQAARAYAVAQGSPARVLALREGRAIQRTGLRPIGGWHFEGDGTEGAFSLKLDLRGARVVEEGRIGSALSFEEGGFAEAPVGSLSAWSTRDGFGFEADVRVDHGGGIVARRGESWKLEVRGDGSVGADVTLVSATKGEEVRGERLRVETVPGLVLEGRWARLGLFYDRLHLRLSVDGVERARSRRARERVWLDPSPLRLSDPERTFHGAVDEVRVSSVVADEPRVLPDGVEFGQDLLEIRFDAAGNLDPSFHDGPVSVGLLYDGGARRAVEVGSYGTLR